MKKDREVRVSVRVPAELKQRILDCAKRVGQDEATVVRACVEALCDYIETRGEITFPFTLTPKSRELLLAAEERTPYGASQKKGRKAAS